MSPHERWMVFHTPFPIEQDSASASGIRPRKMLEAFSLAGYRILEITGHAKQRRQKLRLLQKKLATGWRPDFAYSEVATIPASFTEPRHLPLVPFLEPRIFSTLRNAGVPLGVFYRDVYWAFPEYAQRVGRLPAAMMRVLYGHELATIRANATAVFLPSLEMAAAIPNLHGPRLCALPPGAEPPTRSHPTWDSSDLDTPGLNLLYVGGVGGDHYDLRKFFAAVRDIPDVTLTVCTRPAQWNEARRTHGAYVGTNIKVVHETFPELQRLYDRADVAVLALEPGDYRRFAVPMKLYEYLGQGKPVLATSGTLAGDLVAKEKVGWVVAHDSGEMRRQIKSLLNDPQQVTTRGERARDLAGDNTWLDRAHTVASCLSAG